MVSPPQITSLYINEQKDKTARSTKLSTVMKLSVYLQLSEEEKDKFNSSLQGLNTSGTYEKKFAPNQRRLNNDVSCLYCSKAFATMDRENLTIELDEDCIFNGNLISREKGEIDCQMSWSGYASTIYDGEVHLTQVSPKAIIKGKVGEHPPATEHFHFEGIEPQNGCVWPGFLCIHKLLPASPLYAQLFKE